MATKSKKPKLYRSAATVRCAGARSATSGPTARSAASSPLGISLSAVPPTGKPTGGTNRRTPPLRPSSPTSAPGRALMGVAAPTSSSRGAGPGGPGVLL